MTYNSERHHHTRERFTASRRGGSVGALQATVVITGGFMLVEAAVGFLSNSLALLADAAHMFTDVTALVISLVAVHLIALPANLRMTYGYYRLEVLAALLNGILLLGLTVLLVAEAVERIGAPEPVLGIPMLAVAVLGLLANLAALTILRRAQGGLNIRSAMMHVVSDAAGSAATLGAALVVLVTGWTVADSIISLAISALIVLGAVRIVAEAIQVLMEGTPGHLDLSKVEQSLRAVPGVREVHDLHAWTVTSGLYALSAHVVVNDAVRQEDILSRLKGLLLEQFDLVHTTLQIEGETFAEVRGHV
jgi:cobalt-zinc-cadmium efflux system protein